jgi:hypothetical protein
MWLLGARIMGTGETAKEEFLSQRQEVANRFVEYVHRTLLNQSNFDSSSQQEMLYHLSQDNWLPQIVVGGAFSQLAAILPITGGKDGPTMLHVAYILVDMYDEVITRPYEWRQWTKQDYETVTTEAKVPVVAQ